MQKKSSDYIGLMPRIKVDLAEKSYEIVIESGLLEKAGSEIANVCRGRRVMIVTEPKVGELYLDKVIDSLKSAGFEVNSANVPGGEENKTLEVVASLYEELLNAHIDRSGVLITLGGGVVGDTGGFAAATYMRGIDFVHIPTTLLAQVDASIGGKVGVDLPRGKNLVGAFHQPKLVLIDPNVLKTLPRRELISGLAEVIKHGIIADRNLFEFLQANTDAVLNLENAAIERVILDSCRVKAKVVMQDEKESGLRAILNYGHTVGHGIEAAGGFSRYTHGEAIAIGMVTAALIAEDKGITGADTPKHIAKTISSFGLPHKPDETISADAIIEAMAYDKKSRAGKLRFILPKKIGEVIISDTVTESDVINALARQQKAGLQ